ncbi:MAG: type VI secretion system-associated FHA domain protein TagH [Pseudomonadota bacterium]|nr:type VI secretion system-associated FHA domain protein TagH [Pseudomonadota bacterium]
MTLRLSVVSEHGIRLGAQSTKVFGVHGGSIGRGTDNDWILPDPERYLSGKHARIDFRAGSYVLVDTSSNGTYVNGAQVPLGKYHDYSLKDGDYVRLGEYELLVSIDKSNDFPPDQSAIVAYDGASHSSAVRKSTANDLGADLDLNELLEPSDRLTALPGERLTADSGVRPRNAYGQAIGAGSQTPQPDEAATPWHMMTRPLTVEGKPASPAAGVAATGVAVAVTAAPTPSFGTTAGPAAGFPAQTPRTPTPVLFDADCDAGLAAFCRGAGVDARTITPDTRSAALQLAGQLLRESVLGLMDLNQSRNEFRNRFRIPAPSEGPESPLNFSQGVDEALVRLLTNLSERASSVRAIRENFKELKAQNTASLVATRSAFEDFLERLDPKELEERFDRAAKRGVFGTPNKGKYWELYAEMFPGLVQRPADGFPHLFTEAFAKAYEAKLRTLIPPRRSAFGADRHDSIEPDDKAVGHP